MLSILWSLVAFIGALGLLITVHEFGHFLVARFCGVKVERFSIGFGKILWRFSDRYDTEYVIALIPLGGYVKMLDERTQGCVSSKFSHQAFNNKTILQRTLIITAGSAANLIFAIFIYWFVFIHGISVVRPVVNKVINHSIAAEAEIKSGMELKAIDGINTPDWDTVRMILLSKIGNSKVIFSVSQFGDHKIQQKYINLYKWKFNPDKEDPVITLGILPYSNTQVKMVVANVQFNSPAYIAGFQAGDKIIKLNGQFLTRWQDFALKLQNNTYTKVIEVERNGKNLQLKMILNNTLVNNKGSFAGIIPSTTPITDKYKTVKQFGPLNAISAATLKTWELIKITMSMLEKLVSGDVKLNHLHGPVAIAQGARLSADYGVLCYLMFLALISINLGIVNLLPLPVLDGGHLLFLLIEKIKGKQVSDRVQNVSYRIGSILLVLLMGLALFNDFSHLLIARK
ncbi:sigma E protease regulator RseP [Pantoea sp. Mhis]|uniref:sigma E protease regulator RseP n=1 Tax=Pantoea sp. Mhis TaxID=2576759 RepID=UPI0013591769|nr:sigma E protease regulator RseP [Pantoea sp. Mhis]MXP56355.1 sigma E protease regulator RseP [Pantoea sp. Mhis]